MDPVRRVDFSEFLTKSLGDLQCIDIQVVPPCRFIACLMRLSMMAATKSSDLGDEQHEGGQ